jgi:hypothetical protein
MQRMPQTTEPFSRSFLDETFFWTLGDEKERQGGVSAQRPRDRLWRELEHSDSRSGIRRAQASPADPSRFSANGLASFTSSSYRDTAGGAVRVRSSFLLFRRC